MTSEADIKRTVVKDFKVRGHYARRIEDAFSVGFPDLVLIPKGYPVFFTEAKIIRDNLFGPTARQYVELERLAVSKHSVPTLLGWKGGFFFIARYCEQTHWKDCIMQGPDENIVDLFKRYYHERIEI